MRRFIECLLPYSTCNLNCSYCYIVQQNRRTARQPEFEYSPEHIGRALSAERLGGISYISICGAGETLLPKEITGIAQNILKQGHFVNITTNGTITHRHKEIVETIAPELLKRLHFAFSFHYLELLRTNKLETFFNNVSLAREAGCSFVVQINLCDEYMPHWDDIKEIVKKHTGALPQVTLTRDLDRRKYTIFTSRSKEEYAAIGREMNSPLFEFTLKNFMVKRREFCYAGDWSAKLNLATGVMTSCYGNGIAQNIFKDPDKEIKFEAIGKNCIYDFCFNSSHFMSLGVIPEVATPSYADLRNREEAGWYTEEMKEFLSGRLSEDNEKYTGSRKALVNAKYRIMHLPRRAKMKLLDLHGLISKK